MTLDIGFGPFKARVIGPPEEEEVAEMDANPLNLLVAFVFWSCQVLWGGTQSK